MCLVEMLAPQWALCEHGLLITTSRDSNTSIKTAKVSSLICCSRFVTQSNVVARLQVAWWICAPGTLYRQCSDDADCRRNISGWSVFSLLHLQLVTCPCKPVLRFEQRRCGHQCTSGTRAISTGAPLRSCLIASSLLQWKPASEVDRYGNVLRMLAIAALSVLCYPVALFSSGVTCAAFGCRGVASVIASLRVPQCDCISLEYLRISALKTCVRSLLHLAQSWTAAARSRAILAVNLCTGTTPS